MDNKPHTQETFPVLSTMVKYIRSDEVLNLVPLEGRTVANALGRKVRATASSMNADTWGSAQFSVTLSDKPEFLYKVTLASLTWVDKETKRQMDEEATIQNRYATMDLDPMWGEQWDAHLTFPATNEREQIVVDMDAGAGGILINFTGYGTLMADDGGDQVVIVMDDAHPKVYIWGDVMQEDPTHIISLEKAYVGIASEEVRDGNSDES